MADLTARAFASSQLTERAEAAVPGADVTVDIDAFPFLGRLLVAGTVSRTTVTVAGVETASLRFAEVRADLRGIEVDRGKLLGERELELTGLRTGTVSATLTDDEVSRVVGATVTFRPGAVGVTVRGVTVSAQAAVRDGAFELRPERGPALRLPVPDVPLLPCVADAAVGEGEVVLSCTVTDVPEELLRAASRAANQSG